MDELILTNYQAQVFRDVETLLKTTGNPRGVKVNPKAYYLSKRIAVYIINNISKNQSTTDGATALDVQNVYNWLLYYHPNHHQVHLFLIQVRQLHHHPLQQ